MTADASKYLYDINSRHWKAFRKIILKRDGYRCVRCFGARRLQVHHVKRRVDAPELTFDLDNCIAICWDCHVKEHSKPIPPDVAKWQQFMDQERGASV